MQTNGMQLCSLMRLMCISKRDLSRIYDGIALFPVSSLGYRTTSRIGADSVTVFLRALDYFQGILFLTTNRVGSFDEAFVSRIHVQIGYDPLDESARQQIWDNHFRKLARNHEGGGQEMRYTYQAREYVRNSDKLSRLRWNGREIRNGKMTEDSLDEVRLMCFQRSKRP